MLLDHPTHRARDVETGNLVLEDSVPTENLYQKCEVKLVVSSSEERASVLAALQFVQ